MVILENSFWNSFGTGKKAWVTMYKKHKIKKIKDVGFADPKLFNVSNMPKIYERCLKIKTSDAIRKKTSIHVEIMDMPAIKDIWRTKDSSIKTVIMAYEADSAKVFPFLQNKKKAAAHRQKISAKRTVEISTLFLFLFALLFLSDDLLFQS